MVLLSWLQRRQRKRIGDSWTDDTHGPRNTLTRKVSDSQPQHSCAGTLSPYLRSSQRSSHLVLSPAFSLDPCVHAPCTFFSLVRFSIISSDSSACVARGRLVWSLWSTSAARVSFGQPPKAHQTFSSLFERLFSFSAWQLERLLFGSSSTSAA